MFSEILHLFFPRICFSCNYPLLTHEKILCIECMHTLPRTRHTDIENNELYQKLYGRLPLIHASAYLYFHKKGNVQQLIHHLKYRGHQEIGTLLGQMYADELQKIHLKTPFDAVIPVPLHQKRMKERGYNQVAEFGKTIAKSLKIPYHDTILVRENYTKTQTRKKLLDRSFGQKTVFRAYYTKEMESKHFLIVDDVFTTGATLEASGKALLTIPNAKISLACLAYTH